MKIVDDYSSLDNIQLEKVSATYTQELDCCQSEKDHPDECQILTLETDDGGGGKFIRFKTGEAGWSISDIEELELVINDFKKRYSCEDNSNS